MKKKSSYMTLMPPSVGLTPHGRQLGLYSANVRGVRFKCQKPNYNLDRTRIRKGIYSALIQILIFCFVKGVSPKFVLEKPSCFGPFCRYFPSIFSTLQISIFQFNTRQDKGVDICAINNLTRNFSTYIYIYIPVILIISSSELH